MKNLDVNEELEGWVNSCLAADVAGRFIKGKVDGYNAMVRKGDIVEQEALRFMEPLKEIARHYGLSTGYIEISLVTRASLKASEAAQKAKDFFNGDV